MDSALAAVHPRAYYTRFATKGVRPDGRATHTCRRVTLALGTVGTADGSATIRLGSGTSVVAAVTASVLPLAGSAAAALAADSGSSSSASASSSVTVEVMLPPLASPKFRARGGGPAAALELRRGPAIAREIERIIASCSLLDPSQLVIEPSIAGWRLTIDVVATSADGNVEDASIMAAAAALAFTTLPGATKKGDRWHRLDSMPASAAATASTQAKPAAPVVAPARLHIKSLLLPTTYALIELDSNRSSDEGEVEASSDEPKRVLVADPLASEESLSCAAARVVIAAPLNGSSFTGSGSSSGAGSGLPVAAVTSSGAAVTTDQLAACVALSQQRAGSLAEVLLSAVRAAIGGGGSLS